MSSNSPRRVYYGRNTVTITYRCEICGRSAWARGRVPQCGVCNAPLCKRCNRYGFCATHFKALTLEDQRWAKATALKKKLAYSFSFGLGVILIGILVIWRVDIISWSNFVSFLPLIGVLLGGVVGLAIYLKIITRRATDITQGIAHNYLSGEQTETSIAPQPEKEFAISPDKPIPRYCPQCGSRLTSTDQVCYNCGLRQK